MCHNIPYLDAMQLTQQVMQHQQCIRYTTAVALGVTFRDALYLQQYVRTWCYKDFMVSNFPSKLFPSTDADYRDEKGDQILFVKTTTGVFVYEMALNIIIFMTIHFLPVSYRIPGRVLCI